jgi:hypothetical protein
MKLTMVLIVCQIRICRMKRPSSCTPAPRHHTPSFPRIPYGMLGRCGCPRVFALQLRGRGRRPAVILYREYATLVSAPPTPARATFVSSGSLARALGRSLARSLGRKYMTGRRRACRALTNVRDHVQPRGRSTAGEPLHSHSWR